MRHHFVVIGTIWEAPLIKQIWAQAQQLFAFPNWIRIGKRFSIQFHLMQIFCFANNNNHNNGNQRQHELTIWIYFAVHLTSDKLCAFAFHFRSLLRGQKKNQQLFNYSRMLRMYFFSTSIFFQLFFFCNWIFNSSDWSKQCLFSIIVVCFFISPNI